MSPHYQFSKNQLSELFKQCTVKDTKLYRCVAWDKSGEFYRRMRSYHCQSCISSLNFDTECKICDLVGTWESPRLIPKVEPGQCSDGDQDVDMESDSESESDTNNDSDRIVDVSDDDSD